MNSRARAFNKKKKEFVVYHTTTQADEEQKRVAFFIPETQEIEAPNTNEGSGVSVVEEENPATAPIAEVEDAVVDSIDPPEALTGSPDPSSDASDELVDLNEENGDDLSKEEAEVEEEEEEEDVRSPISAALQMLSEKRPIILAHLAEIAIDADEVKKSGSPIIQQTVDQLLQKTQGVRKSMENATQWCCRAFKNGGITEEEADDFTERVHKVADFCQQAKYIIEALKTKANQESDNKVEE